MDEFEYLGRLKKGQQKFLEENQKTQDSRKKLLDDYQNLKQRLKSLPDTVSQPTMVPIGDVAFFPGTIIHTNEIMVLLGDNWFAERSAKQATEIVDRRIKLVASQLEELEKEYKHIKSNLDYTDSFEQMKEREDMKEIKEDIPSDYEQSRGKKRIAHKPKHGKTPKTISFKTNHDLVEHIKENLPADDEGQQTINHDELMLRLNELEREEQETESCEHANVMESLRNGSYAPPSITAHQEGATPNDEDVSRPNKGVPPDKDVSTHERHVKFENIPPNSVDDIERDGFYGAAMESGNVIRFEHTDSCLQRERSVSDSDLWRSCQFNSPADIYEHFTHTDSSGEDKPKIKSILKKDSRSGSTENLKLRPILKTSPEHRPGTPENTLDEPQSILKTPPDTQASERRPGTPENVLDSILKISNDKEDIYIDPDIFGDGCSDSQIIPILKGGSDLLSSSVVRPRVPKTNELSFSQQQSDDKRSSILKNSATMENSNSSTSNITFCPEVLFDNACGGDFNAASGDSSLRKSILASPDSSVRLKQHTGAIPFPENNTEPKPILKNAQDTRRDADGAVSAEENQQQTTTNEAFSGIIVERNTASLPNETTEKNTTKKPMSKFKASRMKK